MTDKTDEMNHHAAVLAEMERALWKAVEIMGPERVARTICANTWPNKTTTEASLATTFRVGALHAAQTPPPLLTDSELRTCLESAKQQWSKHLTTSPFIPQFIIWYIQRAIETAVRKQFGVPE
jgi:hypothetical protein